MKQEPHCSAHPRFDIDCLECADALNKERYFCPHCVNGIVPMTMDRPCEHCTPTLTNPPKVKP